MNRAGFIGLAGRPNVGKSTLVNRLVGAKVAIVSDRPQTTRRAIRGIATDSHDGWQMILVDLPGVQRPRDPLTARMQRRVELELEAADAALLVVDGHQGIGPGDRFIAGALLGARRETRVVCAVNKRDRLGASQTAEALAAAAELEGVDEVFPVSATTGDGIEPLIGHLVSLLPEGPFAYPPEERSDLPGDVHLAELIREQVLRRVREEVPHAVEVVVDDVDWGERAGGGGSSGGLVSIRAQVWVESRSQKGILIGRGGRMVREVGTAARREIERDLGSPVFLELRVKVRERWRRDDALLDRIGID